MRMDRSLFLTSNKIDECLHHKIYMRLRILSLNLYWNAFCSFYCILDNQILADYSQWNCIQGKSFRKIIKIVKSFRKIINKTFDKELDINVKLSINFVLYLIILPFSSFFFIGIEKVIYFSVFSSRHSNCSSNSSPNSLTMK